MLLVYKGFLVRGSSTHFTRQLVFVHQLSFIHLENQFITNKIGLILSQEGTIHVQPIKKQYNFVESHTASFKILHFYKKDILKQNIVIIIYIFCYIPHYSKKFEIILYNIKRKYCFRLKTNLLLSFQTKRRKLFQSKRK